MRGPEVDVLEIVTTWLKREILLTAVVITVSLTHSIIGLSFVPAVSCQS
jgi:hypothetical protein